MMYEYSEHFIMPLSHDEVVHGKGTLLGRMPGDEWQQFANLRALLAYQYTRPGKPLLFMGAELGVRREWNHDQSLDWHLATGRSMPGWSATSPTLGAVYRERSELWRGDPDLEGFTWLDADDRDHSTYAYMRPRRRPGPRSSLLNLTPVPRHDYRVGRAAGRPVSPGALERRPEVRRQRVRPGASSVDRARRVAAPAAVSFRIGLPPLGARAAHARAG